MTAWLDQGRHCGLPEGPAVEAADHAVAGPLLLRVRAPHHACATRDPRRG